MGKTIYVETGYVNSRSLSDAISDLTIAQQQLNAVVNACDGGFSAAERLALPLVLDPYEGELLSLCAKIGSVRSRLSAYASLLDTGPDDLAAVDESYKQSFVRTLMESSGEWAENNAPFLARVSGVFGFQIPVVVWGRMSEEEQKDTKLAWDLIADISENPYFEERGGMLINAIDAVSATLEGDYSLNTLESYVDAFGGEGGAVSAVLGIVLAPQGNMKKLMDGHDEHLNKASERILDGEVMKGLGYFGLSCVEGLTAIGYGVADAFTEMGAELVEDTLKLSSLPLRYGRYLAPEGSEIRSTLDLWSEKVAEGTEAIGDWISGLL